MIPYSEALTFRAPQKSKAPKPSGGKPPRDSALDDLHRALYGTLHPAAERYAEDERAPEAEGDDGEEGSWLEENAALAAAVALVGAFAVFKLLQKPKAPPLAFSETPPTPPTTNPVSPTPVATP